MIFLSAGHNNKDTGAEYKGFSEYPEALRWVSIIKEYFDNNQAMIVPTGSLSEKVEFINTYAKTLPGEHLAVEIHFNAAMDTDGNHVGEGSETLYFPGSSKGKKTAQLIQSELSEVFRPDRGVKEGWYQASPNKGALYFLKKTSCTALIIEPEFIHHVDKIRKFRCDGCRAIVEALRAWEKI